MRWQLIPLIVTCNLFITACGGGEIPEDDNPTPTPTQALIGPSGVTWHEQINPLLQRSCTRCHSDGGVGVSDFTSYENAAPLAQVMAAFTALGTMPPPAADPSCRDYEGSHGMVISDDERQMFQNWADDGAPKGHLENAPDVEPQVDLSLSEWDIEARIAPYQPLFRADGNMYTCFVVETGREDGFYITGLEAVIDEEEIVHHIVLMMDPNGDVREAANGLPFECFDDTESSDELNVSSMDWTNIAAWAPGSPAIDFGDERGLYVPPGAPLVMQVHYYESSPGASLLEDTSGYRIKTAPAVEDEVYQVYGGLYDFLIPAGDAEYTFTEDQIYPTRGLGQGMSLLGVFPHMHVLGSGFRSWIEHTDGTTSCVVEGEYDFYNQLQYMFEEPVDWRAGDNWVVECTWNNSVSNPNLIYDPPQNASYGEGTGDEMCFFITYVVLL